MNKSIQIICLVIMTLVSAVVLSACGGINENEAFNSFKSAINATSSYNGSLYVEQDVTEDNETTTTKFTYNSQNGNFALIVGDTCTYYVPNGDSVMKYAKTPVTGGGYDYSSETITVDDYNAVIAFYADLSYFELEEDITLSQFKEKALEEYPGATSSSIKFTKESIVYSMACEVQAVINDKNCNLKTTYQYSDKIVGLEYAEQSGEEVSTSTLKIQYKFESTLMPTDFSEYTPSEEFGEEYAQLKSAINAYAENQDSFTVRSTLATGENIVTVSYDSDTGALVVLFNDYKASYYVKAEDESGNYIKYSKELDSVNDAFNYYSDYAIGAEVEEEIAKYLTMYNSYLQNTIADLKTYLFYNFSLEITTVNAYKIEDENHFVVSNDDFAFHFVYDSFLRSIEINGSTVNFDYYFDATLMPTDFSDYPTLASGEFEVEYALLKNAINSFAENQSSFTIRNINLQTNEENFVITYNAQTSVLIIENTKYNTYYYYVPMQDGSSNYMLYSKEFNDENNEYDCYSKIVDGQYVEDEVAWYRDSYHYYVYDTLDDFVKFLESEASSKSTISTEKIGNEYVFSFGYRDYVMSFRYNNRVLSFEACAEDINVYEKDFVYYSFDESRLPTDFSDYQFIAPKDYTEEYELLKNAISAYSENHNSFTFRTVFVINDSVKSIIVSYNAENGDFVIAENNEELYYCYFVALENGNYIKYKKLYNSTTDAFEYTSEIVTSAEVEELVREYLTFYDCYSLNTVDEYKAFIERIYDVSNIEVESITINNEYYFIASNDEFEICFRYDASVLNGLNLKLSSYANQFISIDYNYDESLMPTDFSAYPSVDADNQTEKIEGAEQTEQAYTQFKNVAENLVNYKGSYTFYYTDIMKNNIVSFAVTYDAESACQSVWHNNAHYFVPVGDGSGNYYQYTFDNPNYYTDIISAEEYERTLFKLSTLSSTVSECVFNDLDELKTQLENDGEFEATVSFTKRNDIYTFEIVAISENIQKTFKFKYNNDSLLSIESEFSVNGNYEKSAINIQYNFDSMFFPADFSEYTGV